MSLKSIFVLEEIKEKLLKTLSAILKMEPLENGLDSSAKTRVPKVQKPERWKYLPEQCFPTFWDVSPVNKFFKKIGFAAFWFRVNEGVASGNKGQPIVLVKHTYLFSLLHILNSITCKGFKLLFLKAKCFIWDFFCYCLLATLGSVIWKMTQL